MIFINPGCGKCDKATVSNAQTNIQHFVEDLELDNVKIIRNAKADYDKRYEGDGRFAFILQRDKYKAEIQMPGLPLDNVRYVDILTQNIWHYPRLYVNDSSWVWLFALRCTRATLTGKDEE